MSLKEQLQNYVRLRYRTEKEWVSGNELEQFTLTTGHKASFGARECRRLAEDNMLERRETARGYVEYRHRPIMTQGKPVQSAPTQGTMLG